MKEYMENKFSIEFRHWLKKNPIRYACTFEMKDSLGKDSIPFSNITDQQINYGLAVNSKNGTLIRTQALNEGMPDYCYYYNSPAYVVIKYPKSFSIISIETLLLEKQRSKRKSLTEERAKEISIKTTICR